MSIFTDVPLGSDPRAPGIAASIPSQNWLRAWFKQGPELSLDPSVVERAHAGGALFGGGLDCSTLYRGENGLTAAQLSEMVTRDPLEQPVSADGIRYHGSLANVRYLEYVLQGARRQIDAGADTLWLTGVNGDHAPQEGYDAYSLAAFSQYLVDRYVNANGWEKDDPGWRDRFHIDLANSRECPDHTILSFNYAGYLQQNGWASEPDQAANPLAAVWGSPDDWNANTFCSARNNTAMRYWVEGIHNYGARLHRNVEVAVDSPNPWADYQVLPCPSVIPRGGDGRMSCEGSYLAAWNRIAAVCRGVHRGQDVPIVLFQRVYEGTPWSQLSDEEQAAWIGAYAPEVFASGLFFAYPVLNRQPSTPAPGVVLDAIQPQAAFVREVGPLLHHVEREPLVIVGFDGKAEILVQGQPTQQRLLIHLINRKYDGMSPVAQEKCTVNVPLGVRPRRVVLHAVGGAAAPADWSFSAAAGGSGALVVRVPSLKTWDLLEIDLPRWAPLPGQ